MDKETSSVPHRYATRPGLYFTDDGGADVIVRSETADQVWLSIVEPIDHPSPLNLGAIRIFPDDDETFPEQIARHPISMRILESAYLRETLFKMSGPSYGLWYVHLPQCWTGMRYGFRVAGPWNPARGVRYNPYKLLLDPCGKGIDGTMELCPAAYAYQCELKNGKIVGDPMGAMSTLDSLGHVPMSVAIDDRDTAKHDDDPDHPHIPWHDTVIYELHVKGFTKQAPWLPEELRGTYAGLAHPTTLSYLQNLGVTTIELLPIQAKLTESGLMQDGRDNYWGYSTLSYFSPEPSYATKAAQRAGAEAVRAEVIDMVRAMHAAGFDIIMDVVYNHTCEGGVDGPSLCWRGLDGVSYYRRDKDDYGTLIDTTGCGNTFDFTNTHVVTFAVDSLRYWAKRIGVDGFRFDLGVSLARLEGSFTRHHPFLHALRADQLLGNLKLIQEPWDLGPHGWRTGQFGLPFSEWNDRFREATRKFWLTDAAALEKTGGTTTTLTGMQEMATRLCGSADLFATEPGRGAAAAINYVASHDGFTLGDLTRYDHKHNIANGENNRDGSDVNHSYNFGQEGPTTDRRINDRRERAAMGMLGTLMLSLGTPMLVAGDEFGRTQRGNNNPYCQDNEISWVDWRWMFHTERTPQMRRLELTSKLIATRRALRLFHQEGFFTLLTQLGLLKPSDRVKWSLADGSIPTDEAWRDPTVRAFTMRLLSNQDADVLIVINGAQEDVTFHLPNDVRWKQMWCSAETTGARAGNGETVEEVPRNPEVTWTLHVDQADATVRRVVRDVNAADRARARAATRLGRGVGNARGAAFAAGTGPAVVDAAAMGAASGAGSAVEAAHAGMLRDRATRFRGFAGAQPGASGAGSPAPTPLTVAPADAMPPTPSNVWTVPAMSVCAFRQR